MYPISRVLKKRLHNIVRVYIWGGTYENRQGVYEAVFIGVLSLSIMVIL